MATVHPFPNPMSPRSGLPTVADALRAALAHSRHFRMLVGFLAIFILFAVDAALRFPGRLDIETLRLVQRLDLPYLSVVLDAVDRWTNSEGAIRAWIATLAIFALLRWWLPAVTLFALPLGGVVNESISLFLIHRSRPHLPELRHTSLNFEERSFPSGHVVGAVLLYGFIWYVAGRRVERVRVRRAIRAVCAAIVAMTALDRLWGGAHWPSDVGAAFALGIALLLGLILMSERVEREIAALHGNAGWFEHILTVDNAAPTSLHAASLHLARRTLLALAPPDGVSRVAPAPSPHNRR